MIEYKIKDETEAEGVRRSISKLNQLLEGVISKPSYGLCFHIYFNYHLIHKIFQSWDKTSGCNGYPVPAPFAYRFCSFNHVFKGRVWLAQEYYGTSANKYEGTYGKLRMELAEYMVNVLYRLIAEYEALEAGYEIIDIN